MSKASDHTVLVVEDNETNMALVREILSIDGYKMLEAENGRVGIDMAIETVPDVVLMDINIPEVDGVTAMKEIKGNEKTKSVPIIALTASAMKGDDTKMLDEGFDGYVAKPINLKDLLEEVKNAVNGKGDD